MWEKPQKAGDRGAIRHVPCHAQCVDCTPFETEVAWFRQQATTPAPRRGLPHPTLLVVLQQRLSQFAVAKVAGFAVTGIQMQHEGPALRAARLEGTGSGAASPAVLAMKEEQQEPLVVVEFGRLPAPTPDACGRNSQRSRWPGQATRLCGKPIITETRRP